MAKILVAMRLLLVYFVFALPVALCAQARYHVNQAATGGTQTGANWAEAFTDLQQALAAATTGDTIWVAAGAYKPTATTDRTVSFVLKDGVALYGGFSGTESDLEDRDFEQHKTILSGDIGMLDVRTDNSYHVVRGKGLQENTLLDGFYIRDGYSYNEFTTVPLDRYGAGMLLEGSATVADSRPVIRNCVFEHNDADQGGGLCATWHNFGSPAQMTGPVNPVLRNCTFSRNTATRFGGAFYKNSPSAPSDTFVLEDCKFLDNKALVGQGGGIYFHATANSNTVVRRCIFERDTSWGFAGGGISYHVSPPALSTHNLFLDSCVFIKNVSLEGGAFFFDGFTGLLGGEGLTLNCKIQHCVFEDNLARHTNGSAYLMYFRDDAKLNIEVEDCVFVGNLASDITALITMSEYNDSYLKVDRCLFYNNKDRAGPNRICFALSHAGGRYNTINSEITNCTFYKNGGGVISTSQAPNHNTTRIANCTFVENNEYIFVKTWDTLFNQPNGYFNDFFIDNCIIWEPGTDLRKMFYNNEPLVSNMFGYHVNNTLLNLTDSTSVPGAADAFQEGIIRGQSPGFADSLAGDFRLLPCSPAVNAGNNDVVFDLGLQDDLDGQPRIRYDTVDLGAYEQQNFCAWVRTVMPPGVLPLALWPNPSPDGTLHLQVLPPPGLGTGLVRVHDAQGREAYRAEVAVSDVITLTLRHLPPGFYTVLLRTAVGEYLGKWTKG